MSSKLSAKLLVLALLVVALPSVASASAARVEGLGLQGDYVMDYNNVFTYPSLVTQYQNLVYGDLGNKALPGGTLGTFEDNNQNPRLADANRSMGAILGNLWGGKIGVWSVNFNENASPISPALGAQYFNRNANEALDLLWGWKMQKTSIGLRLNKSYSSLEGNGTITRPYTGPGTSLGGFNNARQLFNELASEAGSDDWNSLGVGAGATFNFGEAEKASMLDVSGELRWMTFEQSDTTGAQKYEDNGGLSYAFNARYHWEKEGDFHLMPVGNFYRLDLGTKYTSTSGVPIPDTTYKNSVEGINLGLVGNWKLRDSDWFWLGAAYEYSKINFEDITRDVAPSGREEVTYQNMPNIFAALESSLWPWFTVRLGAGRPLFSTLKETNFTVTPNSEIKTKDSPLQYSVGVGFHFAKLDLDAVVNQNFAFTGGWFSSGNSETPFSKLSATYRW